jgi:hypothetical protein
MAILSKGFCALIWHTTAPDQRRPTNVARVDVACVIECGHHPGQAGMRAWECAQSAKKSSISSFISYSGLASSRRGLRRAANSRMTVRASSITRVH